MKEKKIAMNNKERVSRKDFIKGQDFSKDLVDIAKAIVLILDKEGKILFVNPYFEEITGYKLKEIYKKDWFSTFLPEDIQSDIKKIFDKACCGISAAGNVNDIITKSGNLLQVAWYDRTIKDEYNEVSALLVVGHNVTEQVNSERKYKRLFEGMIKAIADITELRDMYTSGHQKRVAVLSCAIAEEMKLSLGDIETIRIAALMHDIGKVSVPLQILIKPDKLTALEYTFIKTHSETGYNLLKRIEELGHIADIVLQHHERLDGSGYPYGLLGDNILPESKIVAVADVVEAMSSLRPYRAPLGIKKAIEEIKVNAGILYDSRVVNACIKVFEKGKVCF